MALKKNTFWMMFLLAVFLCGCSFAKGDEAVGENKLLLKCGLVLNVPAELPSDQGVQSDLCTSSYRDQEGALLLLGALLEGQRNPRWLDMMPSLRIYSKGIDELLSIDNESGIRRDLSGLVQSMNDFAEKNCSLNRRTHMSKLSGGNWKGWIAEDSYQELSRATSRPEYCERFSEHNRCIRMVIGNSKESAVMGQYCLTRRDNDFDLDAGLSYNIFLKIVKSIRFVEG